MRRDKRKNKFKKLLFLIPILFLSFHALMSSAAAKEEPLTEDLFSLSLEDLMNIEIVTATRHKTLLRKAPATATVITAQEIRNMGARSLKDALRMVPGLGLSISNSNRTMLEVRGIRTLLSEKILVMIDGQSLNRNFSGSGINYQFDTLPL